MKLIFWMVITKYKTFRKKKKNTAMRLVSYPVNRNSSRVTYEKYAVHLGKKIPH